MDLKIESLAGSRDGVRLLRLTGPFTLPGIFEFQSLVRSLNDPVVIVDLTAVPFMDSAALGAVIFLHASSLRKQHQYALVGASERLHTLFKVGGVDEILVTLPTIEEAEAKLVN
ncbi:MAG TPA: STAS domain-containing protein [Bryobacteraceae bacterium]|nr:STAS domain-containing protein [Bryobacteraceae bacterium]